eukprot:TRINITY_DN40073_c0_g1_i2.p2 TRINITY_DN40073_c0_g1~~TRINITY_DN40073_c0_g1_i2.p2  ORF type:complete len:103 (+),score=30.72 TRINITY_DN40073_c0_g1_i2:104-412(+)
MIRRPPRSTQGVSSAASDVYKRQVHGIHGIDSDMVSLIPPKDEEPECEDIRIESVSEEKEQASSEEPAVSAEEISIEAEPASVEAIPAEHKEQAQEPQQCFF